MKGPVLLTPYNSDRPVYVQNKVVKYLSTADIDGVRFLYQQCIRKKRSVIFNNEHQMNEPRQICALLTALLSTENLFPTLVSCQNESVPKWHYEFSCVGGLKVSTADELIKEESSDDDFEMPAVVLVTPDQLRHIKMLPVEKWEFFVVEGLEVLISSRYLKSVSTKFRIGIVRHNFLANPEPERKWALMKWANPHLVEDKDEFIDTDRWRQENLLCPFPEYWRRITWLTTEKKEPTESEVENHAALVDDWCRENKITLISRERKKPPTRRTSKRVVNNRIEDLKRKIAKKMKIPSRPLPEEEESADETNVETQQNFDNNALKDDHQNTLKNINAASVAKIIQSRESFIKPSNADSTPKNIKSAVNDTKTQNKSSTSAKAEEDIPKEPSSNEESCPILDLLL